MNNRMMDPKKGHSLYHYIRVCGKCGYEEDYMSDDQKCGSCDAKAVFKVTKRGVS